MNRQDQIKLAQKFYTKLRAIHEDLVYLQKLDDTLRLNKSEIKITLFQINQELRKYHDAARNMERDLDESQKHHFADNEFNLITEGNLR